MILNKIEKLIVQSINKIYKKQTQKKASITEAFYK